MKLLSGRGIFSTSAGARATDSAKGEEEREEEGEDEDEDENGEVALSWGLQDSNLEAELENGKVLGELII